ncbi:MAG: PQQ-dependent sugar dehydrogenase, partial [Chloroflexota bacterium]
MAPAPAPAKADPALPPGFTIETVVKNLNSPVAVTWSPDGRMFIALKAGQVKVVYNGALLPTNFIDLSAQVNDFWDRGLLGIAIHPDFPAAPYVYLLYTYDPPGTTPDSKAERVARLIRVSANPDNLNVALPGSEVVLLGANSTLENIGDPNL